jgi:glycosyltransferase involved in cell wall biosynthesis
VKQQDAQLGVLMPARGGDPFLESALTSLAHQTFSDWRCYLLADGESGASGQMAKSILGPTRVVLLPYPIGKRGLAAGLNFGLRHAAEGLIARWDSDDLSAPERFELQVEVFNANPDCILVCSSAQEIDEQGDVIGIRHLKGDARSLRRQLEWFNPVTHSSVMFRSAQVRRLGCYNPVARGCEDYDLWLRTLTAYPDGVQALSKPLVSYRKHGNQLTNKSMVGPQLSVVSQSRSALSNFKSLNPSFARMKLRDLVWAGWQRFRFP